MRERLAESFSTSAQELAINLCQPRKFHQLNSWWFVASAGGWTANRCLRGRSLRAVLSYLFDFTLALWSVSVSQISMWAVPSMVQVSACVSSAYPLGQTTPGLLLHRLSFWLLRAAVKDCTPGHRPTSGD